MELTLKKSLGQHFLNNEDTCKQIVAHLTQRPFQRLLEVGPGGGAITQYLHQLPNIDFRAVEVDREAIPLLLKKYPALNGKIIQGDILEIPPPFGQPFTIVGNFPYNISSQILFKVLEWRTLVPTMVGMFQKEVAERIVAQPNNKQYGILSVLIQAHYTAEYLFDIPPGHFTPPPKVNSGMVRLERKQESLPVRSDMAFTTLVKAAFNQRRKMLRNPLKPYFSSEALKQDIFSKRAEQLSIHDFAALTFQMS